MTALPGPPDALGMPGPTPPTLSLLAWGTGKAKETLKTPDKVLKAWWDGNGGMGTSRSSSGNLWRLHDKTMNLM